MWNKVKNAASIIAGLFFIIIGIYAAYRILKGGWHAYKSLSDNAQIAIAVAFLSLTGTLFSLYYTKIKDRQLQIDASHSSKKQELYDQFVKDLIEMIANPAKGNDDKFSLRVRKRFMSNSILWSNPKVLSGYHTLRLHAQQPNSDHITTMDIASLLLAFREDLGLSNKGINEQTILEIMYDTQQLDSMGVTFTPKN